MISSLLSYYNWIDFLIILWIDAFQIYTIFLYCCVSIVSKHLNSLFSLLLYFWSLHLQREIDTFYLFNILIMNRELITKIVMSVLGVFLIIPGIMHVGGGIWTIIGWILYIITGMLLLPPIYERLHEEFPSKQWSLYYSIAVVGLWILGVIALGQAPAEDTSTIAHVPYNDMIKSHRISG
jgi:hypothetical protein